MIFNNRYKNNTNNLVNVNNLAIMEMASELTSEQQDRLNRIKVAWNFYEGYHWEDIEMTDKPQITQNYCRPFVNKFVNFELGKGFTISGDADTMKKFYDTEDMKYQKTHINFLDEVWDYSKRDSLCVELGQSKSITGDGWLQIKYYSPEELNDPFGEHPNGAIKVTVVPSNIIFAEYNPKDMSILSKVTIAYPIEVTEQSPILRTIRKKKIVYKQVWTNDKLVISEDNKITTNTVNPYGFIPFVQIKNFPIAGRTEGVGDLEDIIPLNVELNLKNSDISEIIDYHSAPVTVVFGARINNLEKGANKVWGGLSKDARVQNLELNGDLSASVGYIDRLKSSMHDIGGVPRGALGGEQAISNTSGVALQFINKPLIERTDTKRTETKAGIELANKMILNIGLQKGLVQVPNGMTPKEFYYTNCNLPDNLPKDELIELQKIQTELQMGIESKHGAMQRTGKRDIENTLQEIIEEKKQDIALAKFSTGDDVINKTTNPNYNNLDKLEDNTQHLNSGMTNGQTPVEQVRKEITGQNGNQKNSQINE